MIVSRATLLAVVLREIEGKRDDLAILAGLPLAMRIAHGEPERATRSVCFVLSFLFVDGDHRLTRRRQELEG